MVNTTALIKPSKHIDFLFRIELLVVVTTVLFLGMFIVDIFRRHFHDAIVKAILGIVDNVSDSIVLYVMGAMQASPFKNQLFPVWAIVLVGFRHSMDFISGYGIRDQDGRRFTEWRNVIKLLGVAFLNKTRGSMFVYPLWLLWGLQLLKSYYRFRTRNMAFHSVWHGKSSELVSEYMRTGTNHHNLKNEDCKAETMEGYRYLVYGETKQHIVLKKPRYVLHMDTNPRETRSAARAKARAKARGRAQAQIQNSTEAPGKSKARPVPESLITLDKIWRCDGALLHTNSTEADKFKDMSLAFSLSRLIRCRLEDVPLHKDSIPITKNLVKLRIIQEEANRAFGVMEMEMAFLNDYFNTRYPMVFWCGLPSLHLSLIMSIATCVVSFWLSVEIRRVYKVPVGEFARVKNGVNIDVIITWFFLFFMMFREVWEMVSYLLSDWTRVLLACTYVRWAIRLVRNGRMERFISSFLTSKIVDRRWHGVLDQYIFLQSYGDSPSFWNLLRVISTGALPKKEEGATLSDDINIPECVRPAILGALCSLDITRDHLIDVIPTLLTEPRERRYKWACFDLPTSTHIILVWHIATSLCEIRFAQDSGINLSNPGFLLSALLYVKNRCTCTSQPYLVDIDDIHDDDLKNRYTVANSLSRYCAYLVVSKPELLPDRFLVPKMVFQETVKHARSTLKDDDDTLDKRYRRLMGEADTAVEDNSSNSTETRNVLQLGAKLAKQLIHYESPESRWEILAGVWADLLIHIAPSWNAAAHKKCLESGGEFITIIWALLWHCGIQKSMLWPVEDMPRSNPPGAPDNNNAENDSVQAVQGVRQPGGAMERGEEQEVLPEATTDGRHRSGMMNGHSSVVVKGMPNLGNTCYFNAVLQGLLALVQLRNKMLEKDPPGGPLHLELKKLFNLASGANCAGGALSTEDLFSVLSSVNQDFDLGVMEDSNNLLVSVLDALENEKPTMVESLFRGQVAKHVYSRQCEHTSGTTQILDLSLAIPLKEHVSIDDCLDLYANGEVEDWYCKACSAAARNASSNKQEITDTARPQNKESSNLDQKQTGTPTRDRGKLPMLDSDAHQPEDSNNKEEEKIFRSANVQYRITKAPPILTIQLKRFNYVDPGRSDKLNAHVNFQEMLDITKLMEDRSVTNEEYKYCLAAVIVHDGGTLSGGHNFSYVRASNIRQQNGVSPSWFRASDENVTEVSLEEVLNCQAYILFYERVAESKVETQNPETFSPTNHRSERECEIEAARAELQPTVDSPLAGVVSVVAEKESQAGEGDAGQLIQIERTFELSSARVAAAEDRESFSGP